MSDSQFWRLAYDPQQPLIRNPKLRPDDPTIQRICRRLDVPVRIVVPATWPRFVPFPRMARLHRRLR
jgi:hypothetical protein